jgi:hypothetical protein
MPFDHPTSGKPYLSRLLQILAVVCVGVLAAGVSPALGAFPGDNGKIAFSSDRDSGDVDIWTMSPKGSDLVKPDRGVRGL